MDAPKIVVNVVLNAFPGLNGKETPTQYGQHESTPESFKTEFVLPVYLPDGQHVHLSMDVQELRAALDWHTEKQAEL